MKILVAVILCVISSTYAKAADSVGMNLGDVSDYSKEFAFADLMRQATPFESHYTTGQCPFGVWNFYCLGMGSLLLDSNGVPTMLKPNQSALTTIASGESDLPAGDYSFTFEGKGQFAFQYPVTFTEISPGVGTVHIPNGTKTLALKISETNASDPIRSFSLLKQGALKPNYSIFDPLFLKYLSFVSTLRFLNWSRSNNSPIIEWEDRSLMTDLVQSTEKGVAWEYMILLANQLKRNMWINIPHQASDDYVRELANLIGSSLNPDLKVYVEYSNETWNGIFSQHQYVQTKGMEQGLSSNASQAGRYYYVKRSAEVHKIFQDALGEISNDGPNSTTKMVRVLAGQFVVVDHAVEMLNYLTNDLRSTVDVYAVAPYFGYQYGAPENQTWVENLTPSELIELLKGDVTHSLQIVESLKGITDSFGISLVSYEAGQHLAGFGGVENNQKITDLFIATNRHFGMYDIYSQFLSGWSALSGGGMMTLYVFVAAPSKWGSWGLLEDLNQPFYLSPKAMSVADFILGKY
jgi:hypothetical protein